MGGINLKATKNKSKTHNIMPLIIISVVILIISQWVLGKFFFLISSHFGNSNVEVYSTQITSEEKKIIDEFNKLQKTNVAGSELIDFLKSNMKNFSKFTSCNILHSYENYQLSQLDNISRTLNDSSNRNSLLTYIQNNGSLDTNITSLKEVNLNMLKSIDDSKLKDYVQDMKDSGYKIFFNKTSFIPLIDFSFYQSKFSSYMDDYTKDYFQLMNKEQDFKIALNNTSEVTGDNVQAIIINFETYLRENPKSFKENELKEKYCEYIKLYTLGSPKFPVYNKNNILLPELRKSYEKLMVSSSSSELKDIIKKLIEILETSNYSLNNKVEEYVLDSVRGILH